MKNLLLSALMLFAFTFTNAQSDPQFTIGTGATPLAGGYTAGQTYDIIINVDANAVTTEFVLTLTNTVNPSEVGLFYGVGANAAQIDTATLANGIEVRSSAPKSGGFVIKWTAPASGTEILSFALNATSNRTGNVIVWDCTYSLDNASALNKIGCTNNQMVSVANISDLSGVALYPNPTSFDLSFDYTLNKETEVSIKLYDMTGREAANLLEGTYQSGSYADRFDVSNLDRGMYMVRLTMNGQTFVDRLVIQ